VKHLTSGENNLSVIREELYRLPPCLAKHFPLLKFFWSICSNDYTV